MLVTIGAKHINEIPTRHCNKCGFTSGVLSFFVKDSGSKYGRRNLCKECANKVNRENTKSTTYKHKHQLAKRYGITPEEYEACMNTSDCCQICGSGDNLCYDHNHETMKFRGVLCRSCNKAIGQLGDTPRALFLAYEYLLENN